MLIGRMKKNFQTIIIITKYRSLFPLSLSSSLLLTIMFSFLILIPSSIFVFGADPGMAPSQPPSTSSAPPPAATTGEKPSMPPSSTTTTTPPNIPNVEEKKDPNDGDTILSSKSNDKNTEVATKVDKKSTTKTMDFNRGYVTAFALVFGFGFGSENVDMPVDQFLKFKINLENKYVNAPDEFRIGFNLGFIQAIQFLKTNQDVLSSGRR